MLRKESHVEIWGTSGQTEEQTEAGVEWGAGAGGEDGRQGGTDLGGVRHLDCISGLKESFRQNGKF